MDNSTVFHLLTTAAAASKNSTRPQTMDLDTLNTLRFCFQRILVPCVVIIGVLGNFVSVVVLTRRRMRCSTNVYLTALAVADIVYLLFIFILSLEHYPNIHDSKYRLYWSMYGLSHWFCDASSYTSIYLTVSFTVERYIAVCHPIRGQVLCTESRAKRVIAGVIILCFMLTVSTAFEYKLEQETKFKDRTTGKKCDNISQMLKEFGITNDHNLTVDTAPAAIAKIRDMTTVSPTTEVNVVEELAADSAFYDYIDGRRAARDAADYNRSSVNIEERLSACQVYYYIKATGSQLGNNERYKPIFFVFTSTMFMLVPLILLATFNCFLVAAVHRSYKMRHHMTNTRQVDTTTAQENKVTITLIAVVVLFLICQTPAAVQLVYTMNNDSHSNLDKAFNNMCNFLVALNAACNFLLYCALSNKYRKTVKQLFLGRKPTRQNTITSSYFSRNGNSQTTATGTGSSFYNRSPNGASIRNRASKKKPNRFTISPTDYVNFQAEMAKQHAQTQLLAASDFRPEHNAATAIPLLSLSPPSATSEFHLQKSPSDVSIARSQSLVFPVATKHSPDCKDNPNNF